MKDNEVYVNVDNDLYNRVMWVFMDLFSKSNELNNPVYINSIDSYNITNFDVKISSPNKKELKIIVETSKPGFLIGKGGETFDKAQKRLSDSFGKPVTIELIEKNIWKRRT